MSPPPSLEVLAPTIHLSWNSQIRFSEFGRWVNSEKRIPQLHNRYIVRGQDLSEIDRYDSEAGLVIHTTECVRTKEGTHGTCGEVNESRKDSLGRGSIFNFSPLSNPFSIKKNEPKHTNPNRIQVRMIGYKCAKNGETRVIVTLEIPDDAMTNVNRKDIVNKDTAKYRTNKAIVREIVDENGKTYETAQSSMYTSKTLTYTLNNTVEEPAFDMNLEKVCSEGIHFFLNRELAETYDNPPRDGPCRTWYFNGQLYVECNFKDAKYHGLYRMWHEDGQQATECTYKDGKADGLYRKWYVDGQLAMECTYTNGELVE